MDWMMIMYDTIYLIVNNDHKYYKYMEIVIQGNYDGTSFAPVCNCKCTHTQKVHKMCFRI